MRRQERATAVVSRPVSFAVLRNAFSGLERRAIQRHKARVGLGNVRSNGVATALVVTPLEFRRAKPLKRRARARGALSRPEKPQSDFGGVSPQLSLAWRGAQFKRPAVQMRLKVTGALVFPRKRRLDAVRFPAPLHRRHEHEGEDRRAHCAQTSHGGALSHYLADFAEEDFPGSADVQADQKMRSLPWSLSGILTLGPNEEFGDISARNGPLSALSGPRSVYGHVTPATEVVAAGAKIHGALAGQIRCSMAKEAGSAAPEACQTPL
eukprot:scaffold1528_cov198-Pinguiococcus_pyrenoidosus.AAC.3